MQFTPELQLNTLFVLNDKGRIICTREPDPGPGPRFALIRSTRSCAWAVRADVPEDLARELDGLAQQELPVCEPRDPPERAEYYVSLVGGRVESGPAFTFPDALGESGGAVLIDNVRLLAPDFRGWSVEEISGRSPMLAVIEHGYVVSICFCARQSQTAAEAGVETVAAFRGRGFAPRVTAAWASAIRASGRIPIYSTSWSNAASLAVARKLTLVTCASNWSLSD